MVARFSILVLSVVLLASCSGGFTPRQTSEGYLTALGRLDFEGASRYMAEEGRANFSSLKKLYGDLSQAEREKFRVNDWAVTGELVSGDKALVDFTFDKVNRGQLNLHRSGLFWVIDSRTTF